MKNALLRVLAACALTFPLYAQYQTPTVDGVISVGEYAHSSGNYYLTWDATYLYIAVMNIATSDVALLYLDVDPLSTPGGGTNANGNLVAANDGAAFTSLTPNLPFRADARVFISSFGANLRSRDGSGGWTSAVINMADASSSGFTTLETRIRWGALPGLSGVPSSFTWLAMNYTQTIGNPEITDTMPAANPTGVASVSVNQRYFFNVASTADGASTDPFSVQQSTWRVTSNAATGSNSLTEAITNSTADASSSRRYITFGLTTTTISGSDFPSVTKTTTIDGTSQDGGTSPAVTLSGSSSGTGLTLACTACVVHGLTLSNYSTGINVSEGSSNTITTNTMSGNVYGVFAEDPTEDLTIGSLTEPNTLSNNTNALWLNNAGGQTIRGNVFTGNSSSAITNAGVIQPAPTVASALVSGGSLKLRFDLTSNSLSATTQSMRLDLYTADNANAVAQGATYRTTSSCYSGSSLSNKSWTVGSGYAVGDKIVLIATSYSDGACTTPGDGSSGFTSVITTTDGTAITFTGPGNFSDTTKWSGGALPQVGQDFSIVGSCTFDSGAPARAYGNLTMGDGATVSPLSWQSGNSVVLEVMDISNLQSGSVNMTNGGTLRIDGLFSLTSLTSGTGTVQFGGGSFVGAATYHNVAILGAATMIGNTVIVNGNLNIAAGASLTSSGSRILQMAIGASITGSGSISVYRAFINANAQVPVSVNIATTDSFNVAGTLIPDPGVVLSGPSLAGGFNGTVKVTGTAANSFSSQYVFTNYDLTDLTIEYAGSSAQSVDVRTYTGLKINNAAGATVNGNSTINVSGTLTLTAGALTTSTNVQVTNTATTSVVSTSGWVNGTLTRALAVGSNTYAFPVGTSSAKAQADLTFNSVSTSGTVSVGAIAGEHPQVATSGINSAKDANVYWTYQFGSAVYSTYDVTLNFGSIVDGGTTPTAFALRSYNDQTLAWYNKTATPGSTSITATGITGSAGPAYSYVAGNQLIDHYVVTAPTPQSTGIAFTTTVTAEDLLNITANDSSTLVTMSTASPSNVQFDSDGNGVFGDNTKTLTAGTLTISTKDDTAETVTITATDAANKTGSTSAITILLTPSGLVATATGTSSASLSWTAASGATSYEIWRSSLNSAFALHDTTSSTVYSDNGLSSNTTYLYKLKAVYAGGTSGLSPVDAATTVVFTNTSLSGVKVKAVHLTELRTAVNAMRAAVGLTAGTFTDPTITALSTNVKRLHVTELRTALDAARALIGLGTLTYTDSTITALSTKVKAAHVTELRAGTQ